MAVPAQDRISAADSLKAEVAEQRAALAWADSTGDLPAAFTGRMRLVPLVRKNEAVVLLKQAAALANDLGRPDLGSRARRDLARCYADAGDDASAYVEAMLSDSLDRLSASRLLDSLNDEHSVAIARLMAASDSSVQAGTERERRIAAALVEVQRNADRWMWIALATAGVCLLLVIGLLYRMGSTSRKLHTTIDAMRADVDSLKSTANRRKEDRTRSDVVCAIPQSGLVEPSPAPVHEAMRPVVEGMFRKAAPERLATLRDARQREDIDKILRVVSTLKPQLVSFDEARFAPVLARLKAPGAPTRTAQWTADLDDLEAGVKELLGAGDH